MAPSHLVPSRSRFHSKRGISRLLGRRSSLARRNSSAPAISPPAAASSVASPAKSGVTLPPTGAAAVIGIVVMLCVCILGFAGWRMWTWRRNKRATSSEFFNKSTRPGAFNVTDVAYESKCSVSPSFTVGSIDLPNNVKTDMKHSRSVPETYKSSLNYQPRPIYAASDALQETKDTLPPSIIVSHIPLSSSFRTSLPPSYIQPPPPALSSRTASRMQNVRPLSSRPAKFSRLVIVESEFPAKLHDELDIREGEVLRLLAEYADEWCLVQRVGPPNSEKGVIPRFCVVDKPSVPPSKPKHIPRLSTFSKI